MDAANAELQKLSTFDLAFNLATGTYDEKTKFEALRIIREREGKVKQIASVKESAKAATPEKKKAHKEGSKSALIQAQIDSGKTTAREIYDTLMKKKVKVYMPEIYRILKANGL